MQLMFRRRRRVSLDGRSRRARSEPLLVYITGSSYAFSDAVLFAGAGELPAIEAAAAFGTLTPR